jgi:hypothetical protein
VNFTAAPLSVERGYKPAIQLQRQGRTLRQLIPDSPIDHGSSASQRTRQLASRLVVPKKSS